jgi:hypothetical protein
MAVFKVEKEKKPKAKAKAKAAPAAKTDSAILSDIVSRAKPANAGDVEVYIVTAPDYAILKQLAGEA